MRAESDFRSTSTLFTSSPYFPLSCGRQLSWQIPPHRSDGEEGEIERQVKHASVERALPGDAVIMPGGVSESEKARIRNIQD